MNTSTEGPRRVRRLWWAGLFAGLLALGTACNDDSAFGADGQQDNGVPPMPDLGPTGPDADTDCVLVADGRCYDDPALRCAVVRDWVTDGVCDDQDRDCFPGRCSDLPGVMEAIGDCDDLDPDIHPTAAESCTDVDFDCDGAALAGFEALGESCDACGREGKFECGIDDIYRLTCSVYAGQTDALDPLPDEICDGADQDCDGVVDEGCRLPVAAGATLETPAVCPDGAVAVVESGALVLFEPATEGPPIRRVLREAAASPTLPACGVAGLAWLERIDGMPCSAPDDGPIACASTLWFMPPGGAPLRVTGQPGAFGRPAVGDDTIWWHTVLAGRPSLLTWRPDFAGPEVALPGAYSDPTPPDAEGWSAVRAWQDGDARILQVDLDSGGQRSANGAPGGRLRPGPPSQDGAWVAWSGGGDPPVLWVVTDEGEDGFRPVAGPGPQRAPRLAGDVIVWLDGASGGALRTFDLVTGSERLLTDGPVLDDDFAVRRGQVVWVEADEQGDRLLRRSLPGAVAPDPEPEPDMGPPDRDMGRPEPDMGPPDPDMGRPEPDMGSPDPDMALPELDMALPELDMALPEPDMQAAPDAQPAAPDMGPPAPDMGPPDMAP